MAEIRESDDAKTRPTSRQKTLFGSTRRLSILLMVAYLMFVGLLTYWQRSLIYQPRPCGRLLAKQAGLPHAVGDVSVKSFDGLDLHGWLVLAGVSPGSNNVDVNQSLSNDRPVVLYFPGNAGNRSMRDLQLSVMGSLGVSVLLVDYRGYAENSGKPSENNFARDARSAWNYLTSELGVPPHRIVIYGESLGGGVATRLVSELCQEGVEPGGLILQSTFNSLVSVAQTHFPLLPVSLILIDRFPSDSRIGQVTCPILQIHGKRDSIVPFASGQRLFDAAPVRSRHGIEKRQLVMPHTDHNDVYDESPDPRSPLVAELRRFCDDVALAIKP